MVRVVREYKQYDIMIVPSPFSGPLELANSPLVGLYKDKNRTFEQAFISKRDILLQWSVVKAGK